MISEEDYIGLKASILKDDFSEFFKYFWDVSWPGQPLAYNWHIQYLTKALDIVGKRVISRSKKLADLVINIPPSETKSSICSIAWPAWLLANDPSIRIISGSYDRDLSMSLASKTRDIIDSDQFRVLFPDCRLRRDTSAKSYYETTKGGGRRSISSKSSVTGKHAHVIIIDDPIDPNGVRSDKVTSAVNLWMETTLPSRFVNKDSGVMVLVMQRLGNDDPTARMLKQSSKIEHICFPATDQFPIKPAKCKMYYRNGLMNPLRSTPAQLKEIEKKLGPIEFPTQYGQSPGSFEGNMIKRHYFNVSKDLTESIINAPKYWAIDTNLKGSSGSDPIGVLQWCVVNGQIWLTDYWSELMSAPDLVDKLIAEWSRYSSRSSIMFIEPKSSGPAISEYLARSPRINVSQYKMPANAGKVDRLAAVLPTLASKHCNILDLSGWSPNFIDTCAQFPNVKNDEAIDCLTMAFDITFGTRISNKRQFQIL